MEMGSLGDWKELDQVFNTVNSNGIEAFWIGLRRKLTQDWRWSGNSSWLVHRETIDWGIGEPTLQLGENCAVMDSNGKIRDTFCNTQREFICYRNQSSFSEGDEFIFVTSLNSWSDAQKYCQLFYTDLASVSSAADALRIQILVPEGRLCYIGLFKDDFVWEDQSSSSFRNWEPAQPDGSGECACLMSWNRMMDDRWCGDSRPFLCQYEVTFKKVIRLQLQSNKELNDPDITTSLLQQMKQKLVSLGLSKEMDLRWRYQKNGNVLLTQNN
ncbi:hypothetical protein DNTS_021737 [Danionella cerebrum]|uniref:C-type lectin domain-containing protein n=1 Tax=Danionella cerebrum TaxID=2873325 RepID=A0A553NJA7_9TELE|nr:hypothetical protein DNTS_021737 [Danionella translucida]